MIRLNILVVLSFLLCLNFENSYTDNQTLVEQYMQGTIFLNNGRVYHVSNNDNNFCDMSPSDRAYLCKFTLNHLREENYKYNKLNINYLSFTTGESCRTMKVWIQEHNIHVFQRALNCFGHSVVISLDEPETLRHYYQQIVIHPRNTAKIMIFENILNDIYKILEIRTMQWKSIKKRITSNKILFTTPVPRSRTNLSNLYAILYPIHSQLSDYSSNPTNILHSFRYRICKMRYKFEKYNEQSSYVIYQNVPNPKKYDIILLSPTPESNVSVSIVGLLCSTAISNEGVTLESIFIAAGPSDHSVILFKEDNNFPKKYEIFEFIEYVYIEYIAFYLDNKY